MAKKRVISVVRTAEDIACGSFDGDPQPGRISVYAGDDQYVFYVTLEGLRRLHRQIQRVLDQASPPGAPATRPAAKPQRR